MSDRYTRDWEDKRKRILERDNYACRRCGLVKPDNDVHHIIPRRKSFDDSFRNLITLCNRCHRTVENSFKRIGMTNYIRKWIKENESPQLQQERRNEAP